MRNISSWLGAATVVLVLLLAGCASSPIVHVDKDPNVDLRAYKTFAFFPPAPSKAPPDLLGAFAHGGPPPGPFEPTANGDASYTSLQTQALQRATCEQMERQGYAYDPVHPDLRINALLHVDEKFEIRSIPGAYGYIGLGGGIQSGFYRQGTLSIDLVDTRRNALVWQGVAEGRVETQASRDPSAAIESAVAEIFAVFPNGKGK